MTHVERAARAICTTFGYDPDKDDEVGLGGPGDLNWNMFEDHARAVLLAIREPSEAMIDHAQTAIDQCLEQGEPTILADAGWRTMIDVALEEGRSSLGEQPSED